MRIIKKSVIFSTMKNLKHFFEDGRRHWRESCACDILDGVWNGFLSTLPLKETVAPLKNEIFLSELNF